MKKILILSVLILTMLFASSCGMLFTGDVSKVVHEDTELPAVKTYDELVKLVSAMGTDQGRYMYAMDASSPETTIAAEKSENSGTAAPSNSDGDHSETNVQVQGVDESDIVKTDGQYIYQVNGNRIIIAKAYPADQMSIVNTITFDSETFYPSEIYLDSRYLIVIGNTYYSIPVAVDETAVSGGIAPDQGAAETTAAGSTGSSGSSSGSASSPEATIEEPSTDKGRDMMPPIYYQTRETVRVLIYNIEDPANASLVRDFEVEGYYISSRKIDSDLYLVTNRYIYSYYAQEMNEQTLLPWYRDSAKGEDFTAVGYDSIRYFPDGQEASYLIITGLDLDNIEADLNIEAFLGSGQTIYSSMDNLYITVPKWNYDGPTDTVTETTVPATTVPAETGKDDASVSSDIKDEPMTGLVMPVYSYTVNTEIYRFTLNNGKAVFAAKGQIPGTLLNQYSMDEHDGYFRVAATNGSMWGAEGNTSQNNLYVLNSDLKTVGSIENIASGETIYSVRFMGDRGYMVTYRTVDPLFVLDLKNPAEPKILGELKLPGYSSYLHPYDEDHIIGFGMDTVEETVKDEQGNVIGTNAYQLGMKIAMFDVTDVNNPVEEFSTTIGDRGTYSDILYNPKALVFSKEKNILAFPVSVMENSTGSALDYGVFTFQGMYVYQIDPANGGFVLKAQITHLVSQEIADAQSMWYDYNKTVTRGLYINDMFYTLSNAYIKANRIDTYEEAGLLAIPYVEGNTSGYYYPAKTME
jgi:inhibitor of cysteine peptidase